MRPNFGQLGPVISGNRTEVDYYLKSRLVRILDIHCTQTTKVAKKLNLFNGISGHPTATAQMTNNNQSNFKRQNTCDTATIKENSARMGNTRPSTATTPTSKPLAALLSPMDSTRKNLYYFTLPHYVKGPF